MSDKQDLKLDLSKVVTPEDKPERETKNQTQPAKEEDMNVISGNMVLQADKSKESIVRKGNNGASSKKKQVVYVKRWNEALFPRTPTVGPTSPPENDSTFGPGGAIENQPVEAPLASDKSKERNDDGNKRVDGALKNSIRLKQMIQKGLLDDDVLKNMDMDRLKEDEEDFLQTDRRKPLALDRMKLKPIIDRMNEGVIQRTVVGARDLFQ